MRAKKEGGRSLKRAIVAPSSVDVPPSARACTRSAETDYPRDDYCICAQIQPGKCPGMKPPAREECNVEACPQWYTGIWSDVSALSKSVKVTRHKIFENF